MRTRRKNIERTQAPNGRENTLALSNLSPHEIPNPSLIIFATPRRFQTESYRQSWLLNQANYLIEIPSPGPSFEHQANQFVNDRCKIHIVRMPLDKAWRHA